MSDFQPPEGWHHAGGERSRIPTHEGGYYLTVYTQTIWENQHKRRYRECRVDCSGYGSNGPSQHHVEITEREEDYDAGDSYEIEHLASESLRVDRNKRNSKPRQEAAEEQIFSRAVELMEENNAN